MRAEQLMEQVSAILIRAGDEIIMPAYAASVETQHKADGSIVTETDMACQVFIERELASIDPAIGFLGEEMTQQQQLECLHADHTTFWCLDPLDGTTNFATSFPGFAISLALISDGDVTMACTYDPVRRELFSATAGHGATLNGKRICCSQEQELANSVGFVDFKRLNSETASHFASKKIFRSQRNIGSCALEWAWLAAGRGQFIIHGGEKLWDFAGGSLLASEAGCCVGDFSGRALFPVSSLSSPILATCSPTIQEKLKLHLSI